MRRLLRALLPSLLAVAVAVAALLAGAAAAEEPASPGTPSATSNVVEAGSTVEMTYTLTRESGEVIGSSSEDDPIVFVQGSQQVPPGLDAAVLGLAVGEERQGTMGPDEGFGQVDPALFHTVPTDQVPEEARTAGARLMVRDPQGRPHPIRVHEVNEDGIVLDLNHPLAGETLRYAVKIVSIDAPGVAQPPSPHPGPGPEAH